MIRPLKTPQRAAVRIRAPSSHEHSLNAAIVGQILGESGAHGGLSVAGERKLIGGGRGRDESVDGGEGVWWWDVNGGELEREVRVGV